MKLYIPVFSQLVKSHDVLVERALPKKGHLLISTGDRVKPSDEVGECTVSCKQNILAPGFEPNFPHFANKFFYAGQVMGSLSSALIEAPFNGYLTLDEKHGTYTFREVEGRYPLLAGVWGIVEKVRKDRSLLVRTNTIDLTIPFCTKGSFEGELVVFPDVSNKPAGPYLSGFSSGSAGKIIYAGEHLSLELTKEAYKYHVGCLLAASASLEAQLYAKSTGLCLGLLGGFGSAPTPPDIYEVLNKAAGKFVFYQGERNLLRIPLAAKEAGASAKSKKKSPLKYVKKGLKVLVLANPYSGWCGLVDSVDGCSIFVKFPDNPDISEPVKVKLPNVLALE